MNKQEVYAYLTEQKISYEVMEHRALSFASPDELFSIMKLIPGAVTPLGILKRSGGCISIWIRNFRKIK